MDHSSSVVEQTRLQSQLARAMALLKTRSDAIREAAVAAAGAPVDLEEMEYLRAQADKAADAADASAKREGLLRQQVAELNGKRLDARDAIITLENAHVQQIDDLNAEIDRLLAEIARLVAANQQAPLGGRGLTVNDLRALSASGLHPGSSRFMKAKFDYQVGDLPCEHDDDDCMGFERGTMLQVNFGQSMTSSDGMVMGKNLVTGASGYVPYALMEKIEETELPMRRQSRIMGSNFDAMAGQRQRDTARESRAPSADRLLFRLEEARSTRGSPAGSAASPQISRGGSADPLPARTTPAAASAGSTLQRTSLSRSAVQSKISYHSAP